MSDDLRDFVVGVGRSLNRTPADVDPLVDLLLDNWYDTVDSLADITPEELAKLGVPLRFGKELVAASSERGQSRSQQHRGHQLALHKGDSWRGRDGGNNSHAPRREADDRERGGREKGKGTGKGKEKAKGKGKGGKQGFDDEFQHMITLEAEDLDPGFPLKKRMLGENAMNIRHLRQKAGAHLWLRGRGSGFVEEDGRVSDAPMYMMISAKSEKDLEQAVEMANDLIGTVYEEYDAYLEGRSNGGDDGARPNRKNSKGKGKRKGEGKSAKDRGKGKGSSKSKWRDGDGWSDRYDDDEPPRKSARHDDSRGKPAWPATG